MSDNNFNFTISNNEIKISNSKFHSNLINEQIILISTNLIIILIVFISILIPKLWTKKSNIFQIFNNQLNVQSFLPFNYLIIIHFDKKLVPIHKYRNLNLNSKFRFELISSKLKRTINFSVPLKYLINQTYLPNFILQFYRSLIYLIKFFSSFGFTNLEDKEICFLVHRRKILEQITSIRIEFELLIDLNIYLHGLTIYSFNSNFAYYLPFECHIKCNSKFNSFLMSTDANNRKLSKKMLIKPNDSIQKTNSQQTTKQQINTKKSKIFCDLFDLFSPNYFQKSHPYCGYPIDFIYCKLTKILIKWIPKTLQENIAPINRQTSVKLELLYYINLGNQIITNSNNQKVVNENEQIKGILTGNRIKFRETLVFYLFNLNLLFFTLIFGLNVLVVNQNLELLNLLSIILISSLFSLLFTELIVNFYDLYIKRYNRFIQIKTYPTSFKQEFINFTFFLILNLCTFSLFIWSTTLTILIKQHTHHSNYLTYKMGFVNQFLNSKQINYESSSNLIDEILFLLIIYYLSVLIMFRLWTLIISLIRLVFVYLVQLYYNEIRKSFMRFKINDKIKIVQLPSIGTQEEERKEKVKRYKNVRQSLADEELERNLLKYFTKK